MLCITLITPHALITPINLLFLNQWAAADLLIKLVRNVHWSSTKIIFSNQKIHHQNNGLFLSKSNAPKFTLLGLYEILLYSVFTDLFLSSTLLINISVLNRHWRYLSQKNKIYQTQSGGKSTFNLIINQCIHKDHKYVVLKLDLCKQYCHTDQYLSDMFLLWF